MSEELIMMIIGGAFIVLGIIGLIWGKIEESTYYGSAAERNDVREFMERDPLRFEPGAIKIGGRICIAVGVIVGAVGAALMYWIQL